MTIIERRDVANEFVDTDEIEDPACMHLEAGDPYDVFRNYVLPRIEVSSHDEASAEVLTAMRAGRNFSDAVLDTIEALPESKTAKLRAWVHEARGSHIYPYVRFQNDNVWYGLMLTTGGPKDRAIAREALGEHYLSDDFAEYWDFSDAIAGIVNKFPKHMFLFDDNPFVEIKTKKDYDRAISEMNHESSGWEKPGLYDFRDEPPSYYSTVEDFVRVAIIAEAEDVLSSMDIDDIKDVCELLLDRS